MNLIYSGEQLAFRHEARAWLHAHVPREPLPSLDTADGFDMHRAWERTLYQGRWSAVTWPETYGGRGLDLIEWLIFEEEYFRANSPERLNQNGIFLLGPTLMQFGTAEQKARFLPPITSGDEIWAQAWSEPQAGSDLAAVRASATRDGDHYILKGHKIWSSRAVFADWAFGLFRTDTGSERHKGLSLIVFPLKSEGVRVHPIPQIDGEPGFAELFIEGARVPKINRVGDEGQGWQICMATAGFERGLMLRSPARFQATAARLVALFQRHESKVDPAIRSSVVRAWSSAEAYALSVYSTASRLMAGGKIGVEASLNKIFWSELDVQMHRTALAILGARAELLQAAPDGGDVGGWLDGYLFSLAGPIYAGTNEIQRNIVAERLLGLPRG